MQEVAADLFKDFLEASVLLVHLKFSLAQLTLPCVLLGQPADETLLMNERHAAFAFASSLEKVFLVVSHETNAAIIQLLRVYLLLRFHFLFNLISVIKFKS